MKSQDFGNLDFDDLTPIRIAMKIKGKWYAVVEASGETVRRYRNCQYKHTKLGAEGKPENIEGFANADSLLASLCLYEAEVVEATREVTQLLKQVAESTILQWPGKVQKKIVEVAKRISELDEEETVESLEKQLADLQRRLKVLKGGEDPAKNEPDSTTGGLE